MKRKGKVLLTVSFCFFILLQQLAIRYRWTRSSSVKVAYEDVKDALASYEINQLEKLWRETSIEDLVTSGKIANSKYLEQARARLNQAEMGIRESEKRFQGATGKRHEFFQKAHAYYHHSVSVLINMIDFLIVKQDQYSVKGNEIFFERETDAARFRELIDRIFDLQREKEALDTFILNHNHEVDKNLLVR